MPLPSVVMLSVYAKCRMLSVIMLNVVMLSVIMRNVVMLNAVAPHVLQAQAYFSEASATQKKVYFVKHLAAGGSNCQKRSLKKLKKKYFLK
jgi:hypothetical protein